MSKTISKNELTELIREMVRSCMSEMPDEGYVEERTLTAAEEKKKEELVKALKPKYGKTPKTYAIATAKAKELAEDHYFFDMEKDEKNGKEGDVFPPHFGINGSSKFLAIIYNNGVAEDNKYFDTQKEAQAWVDDCCGENIDERMLAFPDKTRTPGRNKQKLPYHSPVSKTLDEMDEEIEFTDKYDDNPSLKGGQSKLPDHLQKAIIQKRKN